MTINPFTLKELRQLTRAKAISVSLVSFLFLSVVLAYIIPVSNGISQDTGPRLFTAIVALLMLMLSVILPANAFLRLSRERGGKTRTDFALLTTLPVAGIVDGKLSGGFALMVLFTAAALPYAIFSYLLHGIYFSSMANVLLYTLCYSAVLLHTAILLASLRFSSVLRNILFGLVFFGAITALVPSCIIVQMELASLDVRIMCIMIAVTVTYCALARAYTIAFLSPLAMERDCAVKATTFAAIAAWGVYTASFAADGRDAYRIATMLWLWTSFAAVVLLAAYSMAQPVGYSRRMLANRPKSAAMRILRWPFATGAANTFFFAAVMAALLAAFVPVVSPWIETRFAKELAGHGILLPYPDAIATVAMYIFAMLLFTRAAWRFVARSANVSPLAAPVSALLIVAVLQTVQRLMDVSGFDLPDWYKYNTIPYNFADIDLYPAEHLMFSGAAFALAALANLPAAFKAFMQQVRKQ